MGSHDTIPFLYRTHVPALNSYSYVVGNYVTIRYYRTYNSYCLPLPLHLQGSASQEFVCYNNIEVFYFGHRVNLNWEQLFLLGTCILMNTN